MSGGHFNYYNDRLREEIYDWTDTANNAFEDKEISNLVWDVLELIHVYDYYICGDTCEETYLKKKNTFKAKWFNQSPEERIRKTIEECLDDARKELYKTYGLNMEADDGK